ncbi:two-component sensor histidine kinase [Paenibacillus selenitireducens]|uniref:histidine kinase n=1 Tax=Paenibacillus selenitireducens TaxID=1324314 RepID=A0A1T2XL07_9BACL|nr:histidine kinase [Paenibacillus selenitireducens]OPA80560.1 two-component sensor histidine kinase [Paenibacillus selenitireducens]
MTKFRRFYRNHLKRKMFNKIILLYSAVMMVLFATAAIMMYQYQMQRIIREQTDANMKTAQVLSLYLNRQYMNIQNMVQQIYGDATLSDDLVYFLNHPYENYLGYRLNQFTKTNEQRPRSYSTLVKNYLEQEPGARRVTIYSYPRKFSMNFERDKQNLEYESGSSDSWENWLMMRHAYIWDTASNALNTSDSVNDSSSQMYSYSRELQDPWTLDKIGMLVVDFDPKQLSAWLSSQVPVNHGQMLVMTSQGKVLYDPTGQYVGQVYPYRHELNTTGKWVELNEPSKVNVLDIGNAGLSVVGIVSKSTIEASMVGLRNTLIIVTLLFFITSFVITSTMMRKYSNKIRRIIVSMSRIGEGDLSTRIQMTGEDELQQISQRFNDMCERLEQYIDKMYTSEIKQKHAELVALQSQINPHFLYNTLESIRMKAYSMGARDVGKMVYSLSVMFKSMVKKNTIVTIEEEIEMCSNYLDLLQIRYEGRLEVEIEMERCISGCSIIKLLIQPIVENYIVHGFRSLDEDNRVMIRAARCGERVAITVKDNGLGIPAERLKEIDQMLSASTHLMEKSNPSIGIINVHDRIRMNYGEDYGITVFSELGKGTEVRMEIPMLKEGIL